MITIPKNIKDMGIYFASSSTSRLFMFLCLPLITNYLTPSEYGMWSIFYTIVVFVIPFSSMMMRTEISRTFFKLNNIELKRLISSITLSNSIFAFLFFIPIFIISLFERTLFGINISYYFIIPIILFFNDLIQMALLYFRYKRNTKSYTVVEISQAMINVLIILVLLYYSELSWELMLIAFIISSFLSALISIYYMLKSNLLSFCLDKNLIRKSLIVGAPLVPHAVSTSIISLSDRIIIEGMLGHESVGIYSAIYILGSALGMFTMAFNKVWGPWVIESLSFNSNRERIVKYSYLFLFGLTFVSLLGGFCSHSYVKHFLSPIYQNYVNIVYWVLAGAFFQGLYFCIFHYMTFLGKTKIYAVLTVTSAIINIVANFYLIEINGIVGAAQATFIAYFFIFIILFIYNQVFMPMPWLYFLRKKHGK